ncbi:MAG: phage portal protein [Comamonadaceae bacterium]|nr:MAG: phage portal protein [Comamonadaceae bacterium]
MGKRNSRSRSMARATSAASAGAAPSMAAYDGANTSDLSLLDWLPAAASADADLLPDLQTLTARSRDLNRNNGVMAGGMQTLRDNIVGSTLRLSTAPDYRLLGKTLEWALEWGNNTEAKFRSWADTTEVDAGRSLNLLGLTLQQLGGAMLNGDALALPLWLPRAGAKWGTRLMAVEADRLCTPLGMEHRDDLRGGIEMDRYGAPVAYHILKRHPGDAFGFGAFGGIAGMPALEWDRVPAFTPWGRRRVVHLLDRERTGQSRGRPIVSAVMNEFQMAGNYATNELKASLAGSLVAAFLESDLSPEASGALFGDKPREQWSTSAKGVARTNADLRNVRKMEAGAVIPLPVGARLNPFVPGRPNQAFEAFMLAVMRNIAAGLNMPYELLMKDFSRTNYSSARASLLEAWRYFNGRRRWLTDYWLRAVYELWLEEAVNAGEVDAPDFYDQRYAYSRARFIFGGRGWVDPVKEATAAKLRMDMGLSTLERECAEQGEDYEEILDQQAIERRMRAARGLPEAGAVQYVSAAAPPKKDDDEEGDDAQEQTA